MKQTKISVVIPVYNAACTLGECLYNLFKTTYSNFEVILVDDASTDNSIEIAKKYTCKIISLFERRGPAYARERGQAAASGEIVAFLDSDCIAPADWLDKIEKKLTPNIIGIGGRYILPEAINPIAAFFITLWDLKNILYTKPRSLVSFSGGNSAFWKSGLGRKRKKRELVYGNSMFGGDDTIMCCELSELGKLVYDPNLYVTHNKKYSFFSIIKETSDLGYSGTIVAGLFGSLLIREPHRFYKFILYAASIFLFIITTLLPVIGAPPLCIGLFIFYIALQLPIISLAAKHMRRKTPVFLFPLVTLVSNLLHLAGHLRIACRLTKKTTASLVWHIKIIVNAINSSALFRIFLFVTKKCNADCYFCFDKGLTQNRQGEEDLSLDEIKKMGAGLPFLPWLTISGGEPFLRKDIYDICKLFYSNSDTRIISIVTNGTLPSYIEEVLEKVLIDCDSLYLTIIVAFDDIGERHDRIKGIAGCYEQAAETLERLKLLQYRFPRLTLAINTTVIKENSSRIGEILEHFSNTLYFDRQCLNLLRELPCTGVNQDLISVQGYFDLVKLRTFRGKSAKKNSSIKQRFNQSLLEYISDSSQEVLRLRGSRRSICLAARKFFVVDNNGDVFACELVREKLGNLRDSGYDIREIIRNPQTSQVRRKIKNTKCYCLWPCATATNTYLRPLSYPRIIPRMITLK